MTLVGKQFGSYQVLDLLGEGAVSYVYRARDDNGTMGDIALKVIKPKLANHGEFKERFKREAQISASLVHPHIIKVYDSGEIDQTNYLTMQVLSGGSLTQYTHKQRLPLNTVSLYLDQIASALDYAHSKQIVHRDLKPENILFDKENKPILSDFGMVKPLDADSITAKDTILGTPAYMSPEQCSLKPVDARSDIYAMGVILFELLTGELPFEANTPIAMMAMHVRKAPALVSSKAPDTSSELDQVINQALAKEPMERFASAGELAAAFKQVAAQSVPTKKRTRPVEKLSDAILQQAVMVQPNPARETRPVNSPDTPSRNQIGLLIVIVLAIIILTIAIVFLFGSVSLTAN